MDGIQLFGRGSLYDQRNSLANALGSTARAMADSLQSWNPDDLLDTATEAVIARLIDKGSVQCPRLLADQVWMRDPIEITQEYTDFGERRTRRVTRLVLVVPFEGEKEVLTLRADTSSTNPPRVLRVDAQEVHLAVDDPPEDGGAVRARFDDQIANIEKYLDWSRRQIESHNQQIRDEVPGMVAARREELLAQRKLQADTGYPTRRPTKTD